MHDLVVIAVVAGLLALDDRAGWQSLLAEPVFSALIIGLVFGHVGAGLRCGVVLQLVWLSIGAARGSRRPNAVAGGVVGAGAACLSLHRTGDPREPLVIAAAVLCGLLAGEAGQWVGTRAGTAREKWLQNFRLPQDAGMASRNIAIYVIGSAAYIALVDALFAVAAVALSIPLIEVIIDHGGALAAGLGVWLTVLPALAVATIAHAFATRALGRMAALGLALTVVAVWLI